MAHSLRRHYVAHSLRRHYVAHSLRRHHVAHCRARTVAYYAPRANLPGTCMLTRRMLLAAPLLATPALAQERFPSRPLRMIIPVGVAGVTDVVGRIIAESMSRTLGQPVVVENIPGAGSSVGAAAFMRAPSDGHTFFIGTNNHAVMKALHKDFAYDVINDFIPLTLVSRQPYMLAVHPSVPATSVPELLAWLRTKGDVANYGATAPGATNHMAGELFKQLMSGDFTVVPYRTAANAVQDLVATAPREALRIFDINLRPPFVSRGVVVRSLQAATVLKLNETELTVLAGWFDLRGTAREQLEALGRRFGLEGIALTLGAAGSRFWRAGDWWEAAARPVAVHDAVGAGDAFTAALALGWLRGWDVPSILAAATEVAGYVCTQPGATPQLPDELVRPFRDSGVSEGS